MEELFRIEKGFKLFQRFGYRVLFTFGIEYGVFAFNEEVSYSSEAYRKGLIAKVYSMVVLRGTGVVFSSSYSSALSVVCVGFVRVRFLNLVSASVILFSVKGFTM